MTVGPPAVTYGHQTDAYSNTLLAPRAPLFELALTFSQHCLPLESKRNDAEVADQEIKYSL